MRFTSTGSRDRQGLQGFLIRSFLFLSVAILLLPTITKAEVEIPVTLRIEDPDATIVNTTINAPESCDVTDTTTSTPTNFTGYKAICILEYAQKQGLITFQVTNWGFGFALDKINDIANAADWSESWILRQNNATATTGIDGVVMNANDELLLTYGPWPMEPLEITTPTTSVELGNSLALHTQAWDDTNNTFVDFTNTATFHVNDTPYESTSGTFDWTPTATGTASVWVEASHKTRSTKTLLSVFETIVEATTTSSTEPIIETPSSTESNTPPSDNSNNNNGGSGGGVIPEDVSVTSEQITNAVNKILEYLKSQQDATGKILDGGTTDWAIMAFGAKGIYAEDVAGGGASLLDFAKTYEFTDPSDLNLCASYPRHALALLAAGIAPTDPLIVSSTEKITSTECNQNDTYGQNGINDDLFALLLLLELGNDTAHPVVSTTLNTILKDQTADGAFTWAGWAAPDITGGALNAVKFAKQKGAAVDDAVIDKAKNYLHAQQLADGGWGFGTSDALTTGWTLMGINALGEGQSDWTNAQGKNPWHVLTGQLKDAGYYEPSWAPGTVDWFATKHAVPALLGKSWPIVLAPKPTPPPPQSNNASSGGGFVPVDQSSSTISVPIPQITSTTSTPEDIKDIEDISTTTLETEFTGTGGPEEDIKKNIVPPLLGEGEGGVIATNSQPENSLTRELVNPLTSTGPILIASTSTIPFQNTARGIFATAATLATTLGAYLVWRFAQTLV